MMSNAGPNSRGAQIYSYEIDESETIVRCSDNWDDFALENEGESVVSRRIRGTSIWDHICDSTTTELYRRIFQSARSGRPIQFFLRCDSPSVRRLLHLSISPTIDGNVRTTSLLFRADYREPPCTLDRCSNENDCVMMCTWCGKMNIGEWHEAEAALERLKEADRSAGVSHGICENCSARIEQQLNFASMRPEIAPAIL